MMLWKREIEQPRVQNHNWLWLQACRICHMRSKTNETCIVNAHIYIYICMYIYNIDSVATVDFYSSEGCFYMPFKISISFNLISGWGTHRHWMRLHKVQLAPRALCSFCVGISNGVLKQKNDFYNFLTSYVSRVSVCNHNSPCYVKDCVPWATKMPMLSCMHRQIDRQTDRQAGRPTDRETDRHTHTHVCMYIIYIYIIYMHSIAMYCACIDSFVSTCLQRCVYEY